MLPIVDTIDFNMGQFFVLLVYLVSRGEAEQIVKVQPVPSLKHLTHARTKTKEGGTIGTPSQWVRGWRYEEGN